MKRAKILVTAAILVLILAGVLIYVLPTYLNEPKSEPTHASDGSDAVWFTSLRLVELNDDLSSGEKATEFKVGQKISLHVGAPMAMSLDVYMRSSTLNVDFGRAEVTAEPQLLADQRKNKDQLVYEFTSPGTYHFCIRQPKHPDYENCAEARVTLTAAAK